MSNPTPNDIDNELRRIEQASQPPRELAREAIARRRARQPPTLSQAMIDSGGDNEVRRQRFVTSAVRFKRRGWLSWLLRR